MITLINVEILLKDVKMVSAERFVQLSMVVLLKPL
jgi:hypothetical protein